MGSGKERRAVIAGWFTSEDGTTRLLGTRCTACGTPYFPRNELACRNPGCSSSHDGTELAEYAFSNRGRIWSYADSRYRPPPPYISAEPFEPYTIAAVELTEERIVILGQTVVGTAALAVGMEVELTTGTLYSDAEAEHITWMWRPVGSAEAPAPPTPSAGATSPAVASSAGAPLRAESARRRRPTGDVAVLGAGMHPWGKWGRSFIEYGLMAARSALADAGLEWPQIQFVAGADTIRNGYPGFIAGATFAQALGWSGARVASCYAACASGAQAINIARTQILAGLCDVALVVGADAAPKGFFKPVGGDRPDDPDWLRFRLLGATNPIYFALYARRRMALYGATLDDFAAVKVKNARHGLANPHARYRKEVGLADVRDSAVVADPLRLLDICATSDGGAAVVLSSMEFARAHGQPDPVRIAALSTITPTFPKTVLDLPDFATDSAMTVPEPDLPFRAAIAQAAYEEAGIGPEDLSLAEVYDLSTALELDWYEDIGLCAPGGAEDLLSSGATTLGGRIPVNPSGGLASFGEAIPAQAIAQVCELTWQLRNQAPGRQVPEARTGIAVNQGLFGHGSAIITIR